MNDMEWNTKTDSESATRRAGGRRHYNALRQSQADHRRGQVVELLGEIGFCRGYQTKIAKALGVHRSTICRDFEYFAMLEHACILWQISNVPPSTQRPLKVFPQSFWSNQRNRV